ncbi:MAG: ribosomal protein S18-alanine N-acetyltransferase [Candidatus Methylomirabilia bacterium]
MAHNSPASQPGSFSIEPMASRDLDSVLAIEQVSFRTPWSREAFLYELEQNQVARAWVARVAGEVAGYLCIWEVGPELHITNLAVHPVWRGQGVARTLLGMILEDARRRRLTHAFLEVRPSNSEARGLYESFGFKVTGRRTGYYYDTGEDALLMRANLATVAVDPSHR